MIYKSDQLVKNMDMELMEWRGGARHFVVLNLS